MDAFGELREKMRLRILRKNNKGIAAIFLAIGIVVLCGFVGLAVDIGYMYVAKGQLQNAADAAALAGAARIKPSDSPVYQQYSARSYAQTFASNNKAAQSPVVVASDYRTNALSTATVSDGNDIQFGHWTQATGFDENGTPINAIRVRARRTVPGASVSAANQGQVRIFFGKILGLLPGGGAGFPFMSASAEATASLVPAEVLPLVVNEYWLDKSNESAKRPYSDLVHTYPSSFVRKKVVTARTVASLAYGKIFAVVGSNADTAMPAACGAGTGASVNGYVDLDYRNSQYAIGSSTWYQLKTVGAASDCTTGCAGTPLAGFTGPAALTQGTVDSARSGVSLNYLYSGYPDNYMLPTAIYERNITDFNPSASYPCGAGLVYPAPTTSNCPFASVAFFSSSGGTPLNTSSPITGQSFYSTYPPGKKVVALVYDGTYQLAASTGANGVTIVGYVLLQIDGYESANPKTLDLDKTPNKLSPSSGNTLYAHAISDIVEPTGPGGVGGCNMALLQDIINLRNAGGAPKLVK